MKRWDRSILKRFALKLDRGWLSTLKQFGAYRCGVFCINGTRKSVTGSDHARDLFLWLKALLKLAPRVRVQRACWLLAIGGIFLNLFISRKKGGFHGFSEFTKLIPHVCILLIVSSTADSVWNAKVSTKYIRSYKSYRCVNYRELLVVLFHSAPPLLSLSLSKGHQIFFSIRAQNVQFLTNVWRTQSTLQCR